jgi:hypothetical protein
MTKSETKECTRTLAALASGLCDAGYAARTLSCLIRSTRGQSTRTEILRMCTPDVIQHPDFNI